MTGYNKMQEIKRRMYAMRNGVVADALRKGGSPYRFVMGVNYPQLREIAADFAGDKDLATELRIDTECRESQLIAPMVMPCGAIGIHDAMDWLASLKSHEAADALCHSLLRREPYALELAGRCLDADDADEPTLYGGIRLAWNLVNDHPEETLSIAEAEIARNRTPTLRLAESLAMEARFILGTE